MANSSPREITGDQWAKQNPHWMLLAKVAFWGMLMLFVFNAVFSEGDGLTAQERVDRYGDGASGADNCYHPLDC